MDVVVQRVQRRDDDLRRQQVTRGEQHQQGTPERDLHPGQRERQERRQEQREEHARYRDVQGVDEVPPHVPAGPVEGAPIADGKVARPLNAAARRQREAAGDGYRVRDMERVAGHRELG